MSARRASRRALLVSLAAGAGAALAGTLGRSLRRRSRHAPADDPSSLDLRDAARAVRARTLSPMDLARACLARVDRLDSRLHAFITVMPERALADARQAEDEIAKGRWRGPLHGIPIALKDNIDTADVRTTAASAVFANRIPTEDAEVVQRLKAAGAIVLGKLNMHEFALGTTSAISHFGAVRNPWDLDRIAGGSSGGSGAAVAAGLCFGAVGTDTGGSIRIPAACCGIVGLKPTFGVISTLGTVPASRSFDHLGPMCRTVADTALMFRAMTDHPAAQEYDPDAPSRVSSLRVGVVRTGGGVCEAPVEPEVQAAVDAAVDVIRSMVAVTRDAELPVPDLGSLTDAEIYRFHRQYFDATPDLYDPRTRREIERGKAISDEETERLQLALQRHRAAAQDTFSRVDLVVAPTLPGLPLLVGDATEPFALNSCTFVFSLGGWPAISVPCGFSRSGLPIGLTIGGPPLAEPRILALAEAYERATEWHTRRPPA